MPRTLVLPSDPIFLTTSDGRFFLTVDHDRGGLLVANREAGEQPPADDAWERFELERISDSKIAIRSVSTMGGRYPPKYLRASEGGGDGQSVFADREEAFAHEEWILVDVGDGLVALETAHSAFFVCAEECGGGDVHVDRSYAGPWESFRPSVPLFVDEDVRPPTPVNPFQRIAGRVRVERGRFVDDAGPWAYLALTEFDCIHLARTGDVAELTRRLDRARSNGRTVVRVLSMARNLFDLRPDQPEYYDAIVRVLDESGARGLRVELVAFADAQLVFPTNDDAIADPDKCRDHLEWLLENWGADPRIVWQLANEPDFNGFTSATDPILIEFAELTASRLGHRDFSIGDAPDGDDPDASQSTIDQSAILAEYCNIIVLHSSRKGGANVQDDGRLRRWVDHLEGFFDVIHAVRDVCGREVAGAHDEPMGAASIQYVPLPNGKTYEREPDPNVHVAASMTAWFIGSGYCYHYISAQNDGTPGLDLVASLVARLKPDASWSYRNDSWQGSATAGFTWQGGKVRTWTNGSEAIVLAYGTAKGSVTWANGFTPREIWFDSKPGETPCTVWYCRKGATTYDRLTVRNL